MEVLSTNMMGKLDILRHYSNAFHMDHAKVGILQEASQIVVCSFLQSHDHVDPGSAGHTCPLPGQFCRPDAKRGTCI